MAICPELTGNHEDVEIFYDQLSKNKATTKFQEIKSPAVQTVKEVLKAA